MKNEEKTLRLDTAGFLGLALDELRGGRSVIIPVSGQSMHPFIVGGRDRVALALPEGNEGKGKIVLAWVDGCRYVLHRIVRADASGITLQGDGNVGLTEHCTRDDIKAVATHIVRDGGQQAALYARDRIIMYKAWMLLSPIRRYLLFAWRRTVLKAVRWSAGG